MASRPCCCISSRTGALIIGILKMIFFLLGIIYSVLAIVDMRSEIVIIQPLEDAVLKQQIIQIHREFITQGERWVGVEYKYEHDFTILYAYLTLLAVLSIVGLALSSMLVHGIRKESPQLIKVYLFIYGVFIIISSVIGTIAFMIMSVKIEYILLTIFPYSLDVYFFVVIYYAFVEIRSRSNVV